MNLFLQNAKKYTDPEKMAADFLNIYFRNREISYPFNPFQMLSDMGIAFSMRPFHKLEGVYMPANGADDLAVVGINLDRPITRQRYTAAHELCHHLRDSNNRCICTPNAQDRIEKFAEGFAAAVLMPLKELNRQVSIRSVNGYVDFDGVLEIAQYFGVSFESCLYRIAYKLKAIDGDTKYPALKKRIRTYKVKEKRADRGFNDLELYEGLIDACSGFLSFTPNDYARFVFQNHYIYNDSRMEGVNTDQETAAEIVTDLRLNQQNSPYCIEENEAYLSIAGHYTMYQEILKDPVTTASVTLPTPTRDGYDFMGWATSNTASSGTTGSYKPSGNVTLYAIWGAKGLIYIGNEAYQIYIGNGSSWDLYAPYVGNGSSWDLCS